eukprot:s1073_g9.t1
MSLTEATYVTVRQFKTSGGLLQINGRRYLIYDHYDQDSIFVNSSIRWTSEPKCQSWSSESGCLSWSEEKLLICIGKHEQLSEDTSDRGDISTGGSAGDQVFVVLFGSCCAGCTVVIVTICCCECCCKEKDQEGPEASPSPSRQLEDGVLPVLPSLPREREHSEPPELPVTKQLLGISAAYVLEIFPALARQSTGLENPNFYEMAPVVAMGESGLGYGKTCSEDGEPNCSIVDAVEEHHKGKVTYFVLNDFVGALRAWMEGHRINAREAYLWICFFCNNQYRLPKSGTFFSSAHELQTVLESRLAKAGQMLFVVDAETTCTKRAWCLFEVFTCVDKQLPITIMLPATREGLQEAATSKADEDMINEVVLASAGFDAANAREDALDGREPKAAISSEEGAHEPGDLLWRAVDWHRSGSRGEKQKLAFLRQGLTQGKLSNSYPWILDEQYIANSRASVKFEVLAQEEDKVWISSDEEEGEPTGEPVWRVKAKSEVPVKLEPKGSLARQAIVKTQEPKAISISSYPKEPLFPPPIRQASSSSSSVPGPVPKAAVAKASPPVQSSQASSSLSSVTSVPVPISSVRPPLPSAPAKAKSFGPSVVTEVRPAQAKWKVANPLTLQTAKPAGSKVSGRLFNTSTRNFRGLAGLCIQTASGSLETLRAENVFVLALDWYQTLSRSRTASAEAIQRIPEENLELIRNLKRKFQGRILICIVSFISGSIKNLTFWKCVRTPTAYQTLFLLCSSLKRSAEGGNDKNPNAAPAKAGKPDKKPDKEPKEKPKKEAKPKKEKKEDPKKDDSKGQGGTTSAPAVNAAPGTSKGNGKGKKGSASSADKSAKLTKDEKSKLPCMYFAIDSCTKGDKCPYLHDKNNMYKGPKPKPLTKSTPAGSAKVSAGAATVIASIAASDTVVGAGARSLPAPHQLSDVEEDGNSVVRACKKIWKRVKDGHGDMQNQTKRIMGVNGIQVQCCFAAIAAICGPTGYHQEFLVDSGAGRNLISSKDMPVQWNDFVADAPEQLKFATGGGVRPSSKAIKLKGDLTGAGEGIFYALKDCPAALSLGQQVNEQGKAWVWFQNQVPCFIQSYRLADVTFHCPENAKIYVDRVEQNVPILAENVECLAMPAGPKEPGSSSSSSGAEPSSAAPVASDVTGEGGERLHREEREKKKP